MDSLKVRDARPTVIGAEPVTEPAVRRRVALSASKGVICTCAIPPVNVVVDGYPGPCGGSAPPPGEECSPLHVTVPPDPPPPPPDLAVKVTTPAAQYTLGVLAVNVSAAVPAPSLYAALTPTTLLVTEELRCVVAV